MSENVPREGGHAAYGEMVEELRQLLDAVALAGLDEPHAAAFTDEFRRLRSELTPHRVPDADRVFGRVAELPGRGQTLVPALAMQQIAPDRVRGSVVFGPYYDDGHGSVLDGAVALVVDEAFAMLTGGAAGQTAYVRIDHQARAPLHASLTVEAWVEQMEGEDRVLAATVSDRHTICAQAEARVTAA